MSVSAMSWRQRVERVLADVDLVRPVFQPIFDLERGRICGYEALARFQIAPQSSPEEWLQAAGDYGLEGPFEAVLLEAGLRARTLLPENCFLTVNVSPTLLTHDAVRDVIERAGSLDAVVFELTERESVSDYACLAGALATVRGRGGMVAVDDAGAGYASLQHILSLRPEFIKLDRALVSGIDTDAAKLALVESVGAFAARIDAWVVAEGIERHAELDAVRAIGVPLAQGFGLGRPAPEMHGGAGELDAYVRDVPTGGSDLAAILAHPVPLREHDLELARRRFESEPSADFLVVIDELDRPRGLLRRETRSTDGYEVLLSPMCVMISESPDEIARRAMTRPYGRRFDPIVARDERGRYVGLLATDQLVHLLSRIIKERKPT